MSDGEAKVFEGWAILELMGHRRLAGKISEVEIAGQGFLRLEIPANDEESLAGATQFYSPAAVYALTPTTEEIARAVRSRPAPVQRWELPALLPAPMRPLSDFQDSADLGEAREVDMMDASIPDEYDGPHY